MGTNPWLRTAQNSTHDPDGASPAGDPPEVPPVTPLTGLPGAGPFWGSFDEAPFDEGPFDDSPEFWPVAPLTGPARPQAGVGDTGALPVQPRPVGLVWVVGAHGGAGESALVGAGRGLGGAERSWPGGGQPCVLVARTSHRGLLAAQAALAQWAAGGAQSTLLGLVLIADAPGRLPKPLRDLAAVVGGGAPRVWQVGWSEAVRMGDADPQVWRKVLADLARLGVPGSDAAAS